MTTLHFFFNFEIYFSLHMYLFCKYIYEYRNSEWNNTMLYYSYLLIIFCTISVYFHASSLVSYSILHPPATVKLLNIYKLWLTERTMTYTGSFILVTSECSTGGKPELILKSTHQTVLKCHFTDVVFSQWCSSVVRAQIWSLEVCTKWWGRYCVYTKVLANTRLIWKDLLHLITSCNHGIMKSYHIAL